MYLSSFGLITINGSVTKLEPNQNFENYQLAMSNYGTTLALKTRVDAQQKKHGETVRSHNQAEHKNKPEISS